MQQEGKRKKSENGDIDENDKKEFILMQAYDFEEDETPMFYVFPHETLEDAPAAMVAAMKKSRKNFFDVNLYFECGKLEDADFGGLLDKADARKVDAEKEKKKKEKEEKEEEKKEEDEEDDEEDEEEEKSEADIRIAAILDWFQAMHTPDNQLDSPTSFNGVLPNNIVMLMNITYKGDM